jgi:hypothetical protein
MYAIYDLTTGKKIECGFRTEIEADWYIEQNSLKNCYIAEDK